MKQEARPALGWLLVTGERDQSSGAGCPALFCLSGLRISAVASQLPQQQLWAWRTATEVKLGAGRGEAGCLPANEPRLLDLQWVAGAFINDGLAWQHGSVAAPTSPDVADLKVAPGRPSTLGGLHAGLPSPACRAARTHSTVAGKSFGGRLPASGESERPTLRAFNKSETATGGEAQGPTAYCCVLWDTAHWQPTQHTRLCCLAGLVAGSHLEAVCQRLPRRRPGWQLPWTNTVTSRSAFWAELDGQTCERPGLACQATHGSIQSRLLHSLAASTPACSQVAFTTGPGLKCSKGSDIPTPRGSLPTLTVSSWRKQGEPVSKMAEKAVQG